MKRLRENDWSRRYQEVLRRLDIPKSVVLFVNGEDVEIHSVGQVSNLNTSEISHDSAIPIGSLTKPLVAHGILEALANAGVDPTRPLSETTSFHHSNPLMSAELNFLDLLSGRSGLSINHLGEFGSNLRAREITNLHQNSAMMHSFRANHRMSNADFIAAAELASQVSEFDVSTFSSSAIVSSLTPGERNKNDVCGTELYEDSFVDSPSEMVASEVGASHLTLTPERISELIRYLINPSATLEQHTHFTKEHFEFFLTPRAIVYRPNTRMFALGFYRNLSQDDDVLWLNSHSLGSVCELYVDRREEIGYFVFLGRSDHVARLALSRALRSRIRGKEGLHELDRAENLALANKRRKQDAYFKSVNDPSDRSVDLDQLVGIYESDSFGDCLVSRVGDTVLTLEFSQWIFYNGYLVQISGEKFGFIFDYVVSASDLFTLTGEEPIFAFDAARNKSNKIKLFGAWFQQRLD